MSATGGSGGGLGGFRAILLWLLVIVGGYMLFTGGKDLPAIPGDILPPPADPSVYDQAAEENAQRASRIRTAQAQGTQDAQAWSDRQTQDVWNEIVQQTSAVELAQTQAAWQVTVEAGQAQGTATAEAQETAARQTQIVVDNKAAADNIVLADAQHASTLQAQKDAIQIQKDIVSAQVGYQLRYWPAVLGFIIVTAGLVAGWKILRMREKTNIRTIKRNLDGSIEGVAMEGKLFNLDRSPGVAVDPKQPVPELTDAQMEITKREQAVQGIRGLTRAGLTRPARAAAETMTTGQQGMLPEQTQAESLPEMAPWDALDSWQGGNFPLGIGTGSTGITLNPERTPNLLIAGTSGSGKTMSGLRPIIAEALATQYQVILLNEKGGDFTPLKSHNNLIAIEGKAPEIADVLERISSEMDRRDQLLKAAGASTYYRMPNAASEIGPRLMVVIDEVVSMINGAPSQALTTQLWRMAIDISSKCRAMGLMMVFATTDPTYRTLGRQGLTVRDNCGRLVFRMRDMSSSRAALDVPGAETLTGSQFIAQLDAAPVRGVAFHPEDADLTRFLAQRPALPLPHPTFLLGPGPQHAETPMFSPEIVSIADKIQDMWLAGRSRREMALAAGFSQYGGSFAAKIDAAINYLTQRGATTATTTTESA